MYTNVVQAKSVSAGAQHTCASLLDGTVRCWGDNTFGQLGDGTSTQRLAPVVVSGLNGVNKVVAGAYHTCALLDTGVVKCWGLGVHVDGSSLPRLTPVTIGLPEAVTMLAVGYNHSCAVNNKQDIYCWGSNSNGQLGDGTFVASPKPTRVKLP